MFSPQALRNGLRRAPLPARECRRGIVTSADVEQARRYCEKQLQNGDYDSYLIRRMVPPASRDAYDALRTLNLELARLPETVSNPTIGRMRMQFWRDSVNNVFAGNPPREPISILLHQAITRLREGPGASSTNSIKFWLLKFINTREKRMENQPFPTLAALEDYAENTYATLMYMTLASIPVQSVHLDHLVSHVGKAAGIVATLRGIPILTAPAQPIKGPSGQGLGNTRNPALLLPLDVMAEVGLREEEVFRHGPGAEGIQDAVFKVATRANDHIITAREILEKLKAGETPGHDYEYEGEDGHVYPVGEEGVNNTANHIGKFAGVMLEAIPASDYLGRLETANFDPWRVKSSWNLPWKLWRALKKERI